VAIGVQLCSAAIVVTAIVPDTSRAAGHWHAVYRTDVVAVANNVVLSN
jgi:hypothetical protein